jgi:hypothetical protein
LAFRSRPLPKTCTYELPLCGDFWSRRPLQRWRTLFLPVRPVNPFDRMIPGENRLNWR